MMITAAVAKVISKSVYRCNGVKSATRSSRLAIGLSMDDWVGAECTVLNIVLKAGAGEIDTSILNILDISNQSILPCGIQSCEADAGSYPGCLSKSPAVGTMFKLIQFSIEMMNLCAHLGHFRIRPWKLPGASVFPLRDSAAIFSPCGLSHSRPCLQAGHITYSLFNR